MSMRIRAALYNIYYPQHDQYTPRTDKNGLIQYVPVNKVMN